MTPRAADFQVKSATTAKKKFEDSDAETPGLKNRKIQSLLKSTSSDDDQIPKKKKP